MKSSAKEIPFTIRRSRHHLAAVLHRQRDRSLVVLAHGFTGNKVEQGRLFVDCARALAAGGISALRFDFMGSGDSSGSFQQMTPNSEIADLNAVLDWAKRRYRHVGVLGLSFGGAISIFTVAGRRTGEIAALCTWSTVPSLKVWKRVPRKSELNPENVQRVGRAFFTDRPRADVPEVYVRLPLPKLQIQGDADLPRFRETFAKYFPRAQAPKRHIVLPGADHVFSRASDRARVLAETVAFFRHWLDPQTGGDRRRTKS